MTEPSWKLHASKLPSRLNLVLKTGSRLRAMGARGVKWLKAVLRTGFASGLNSSIMRGLLSSTTAGLTVFQMSLPVNWRGLDI